MPIGHARVSQDDLHPCGELCAPATAVTPYARPRWCTHDVGRQWHDAEITVARRRWVFGELKSRRSMSDQNFDLLTERWVPVSWVGHAEHEPELVGLRELFTRSHEIVDFHAPFAPAASGLMRILVVLAARMTGLGAIRSAEDWEEHRLQVLERKGFEKDEVELVFGDGQAFDLFGPRPFLQDPRLSDECKSSSGLNKLVWDRGAGANQVFLSHAQDASPQPIPSGAAVWHLLAWLYYGASGRCTSRTVKGRTEANTGAGPLRRTLSVHPLGANLYETLILNQVFIGGTALEDTAPWEQVDLGDPVAEPPGPAGLAWTLTGRFRHAVLLVPDASRRNVADAFITWAWRELHSSADDPYIPYQENKEGEPYPLYAEADRAIWRDLDSLLLEVPAGGRSSRPDVIAHVKELPPERCETLRIKAFGYDQDGQTRDKAYFQAVTPPILGTIKSEDRAGKLGAVHKAGTETGESLRRALHGAWTAMAGKPKKAPPWSDAAMAEYWFRAGARFWEIIAVDAPTPVLPNEFILIAVDAYQSATDAYARNPKDIKIIESHRSRLFRGWKNVEPADADTKPSDQGRGGGDGMGADEGQDEPDW